MKYIAIIEGEGENFGMFVPDVLGAVGAGVTAEEALESLKESLAVHLVDLTERGLPWPEPTPADQIDVSEFEPEEPYRFVEVAATTEFEPQRA